VVFQNRDTEWNIVIGKDGKLNGAGFRSAP